jgi:hypothetical protein
MGRSKEHGQLTSEGGVHPDLERQGAQLEGSRGKGHKGRGRTGISIDIETDSKQSKERSHQGQKASELQRKGKHSSDSQGEADGEEPRLDGKSKGQAKAMGGTTHVVHELAGNDATDRTERTGTRRQSQQSMLESPDGRKLISFVLSLATGPRGRREKQGWGWRVKDVLSVRDGGHGD